MKTLVIAAEKALSVAEHHQDSATHLGTTTAAAAAVVCASEPERGVALIGYPPADNALEEDGTLFRPASIVDSSLAYSSGGIAKALVLSPLSDLPCLGNADFGDVESLPTILSLAWSIELEALVLVLEDSILAFDAGREPEEVFQFAQLCRCAEWSPDGCTLAVVQDDGALVGYSSIDFSTVFVIEPREPDESLLDSDDHPCSISWRADGRYLVALVGGKLSVLDAAKRMWLSEMDMAPFQDGSRVVATAWQPAGSGGFIMAAVQTDAGRFELVVFERNGLVYSRATMSPKWKKVTSLSFSSDSQIMGVCGLYAYAEEHPTDDDDNNNDDKSGCRGRIELWSLRNAHWYVHWARTSTRTDPPQCKFSPEDPRALVYNDSKTARWLRVAWSVPLAGAPDVSASCIVDGDFLRLCPLAKRVIPPPMCQALAPLPFTPTCVAAGLSQDLIAAASSRDIALVDVCQALGGESMTIDHLAPAECVTVIRKAIPEGLDVRQMVWKDEETLVLVASQLRPASGHPGTTIAESQDCVGVMRIVQTSQGQRVIADWREVDWKHAGTALLTAACAAAPTGDLHFVDSSGQVWGCVESEQHHLFHLELLSRIKLPEGGVSKLQVRRFGQGSNSNASGNRCFLYACLGWDGSFNIQNSSVMPEGITSFVIHEDVTGHLRIFITTSQGELSVVDIGDVQSAVDLEESSFEIRCLRLVEQGCRIVAALDYETQIVLQMPRGNLETVAPRELVVPSVDNYLKRGLIARAFRLARKQRLSLRRVIDYQWPQFLTLVGSFVSDLRAQPGQILELIHEIRRTGGHTEAMNALRGALLEASGGGTIRDSSKMDLCIVTTYVAATAADDHRPLWSDALLYIKNIRLEEVKSGNATSDKAARCMRHLLSLADTHRDLYEKALELYDLDLALFVASHASTEDPKEYLAELQEFAKIQAGGRRESAIDVRLRRYDKALRNLYPLCLASPSTLDECIVLARRFNLFELLLSLVDDADGPVDWPKKRAVLKAYASHLETAEQFQSAGCTYLAAEETELAHMAFRKSGHWRQAMTTAAIIGYDAETLTRIAEEMLGDLQSMRRFAEAAALCSTYMADPLRAAKLHMEASEWSAAVGQMSRVYSLPQLKDAMLHKILEASRERAQEATDKLRKMTKYRERLKALRQKRRSLRELANNREDDLDAAAGDDQLSVLSSNMSGVTTLSAYSHGTSIVESEASSMSWSARSGSARPKKSKPKAKRNGKIRAGSESEEDDLVKHILSLGASQDHIRSTVDLIEALLLLMQIDHAKTLQDAVVQWTEETQASARVILLDLKDVAREISVPGDSSNNYEDQVVLEFVISQPSNKNKRNGEPCPALSEEFAAAYKAATQLTFPRFASLS